MEEDADGVAPFSSAAEQSQGSTCTARKPPCSVRAEVPHKALVPPAFVFSAPLFQLTWHAFLGWLLPEPFLLHHRASVKGKKDIRKSSALSELPEFPQH